MHFKYNQWNNEALQLMETMWKTQYELFVVICHKWVTFMSATFLILELPTDDKTRFTLYYFTQVFRWLNCYIELVDQKIGTLLLSSIGYHAPTLIGTLSKEPSRPWGGPGHLRYLEENEADSFSCSSSLFIWILQLLLYLQSTETPSSDPLPFVPYKCTPKIITYNIGKQTLDTTTIPW